MNTAATLPAPPAQTPVVDRNGVCTPAWYAFFRTLFYRTGGTSGSSTVDANDLAALALATEDTTAAPQPLPLFAEPPQPDPSIAAFALAASTTAPDQPPPLLTGLFDPASSQTDPLLATLVAAPPAPDPSDPLLAALAAAPSPADATDPLLAAIAAATAQEPPQPAAPAIAVTLGASAASYRAPVDGTLFVAAGTVSLIEVTRDGATYYGTGVTAGPIPLSRADIARVTYTVAPTVNFLPR